MSLANPPAVAKPPGLWFISCMNRWISNSMLSMHRQILHFIVPLNSQIFTYPLLKHYKSLRVLNSFAMFKSTRLIDFYLLFRAGWVDVACWKISYLENSFYYLTSGKSRVWSASSYNAVLAWNARIKIRYSKRLT